MIKFNAFPGFTGSEIERAAMVSGVFPGESALERAAKRQIAKALARLAGYIDPTAVAGYRINARTSHC